MAVIDQSKIRNFFVVAHIDHGKSTLADRIIEKTGLLTSRDAGTGSGQYGPGERAWHYHQGTGRAYRI